MERKLSDKRAAAKWLSILPALACLLAAGSAEAGNYVVKNCANRSVQLKIRSFNATDLIKMSPSQTMTINQYGTGNFSCESQYCTFLVKYPEQVSPLSQHGGTAMYNYNAESKDNWYTTTSDGQGFYFKLQYNENGNIMNTDRATSDFRGCDC